jgi:SAM-dependent methyltransferase
MATQAPAQLDVQRLKEEISTAYARVATNPDGDFHFHRGAEYAVSVLGYDRDELKWVPLEATESFAGVANPLAIDEVAPGQVVLDVGSGAGMDLLIAARRVGERGRAIGVDITTEMIEKAAVAAAKAGLKNVDVRRGDAMNLPVADAEVDVVISNGVVNLTPDKRRAFSEIFRVIKPGGRLLLGDIVVGADLDEKTRSDIDLWTG